MFSSRLQTLVFLQVLSASPLLRAPDLVVVQSTASLGFVTDQSGAVLGTNVTATNLKTSIQSRAQTNQDGMSGFSALTVGVYRVEVTAASFRSGPSGNPGLSRQTQSAVKFLF